MKINLSLDNTGHLKVKKCVRRSFINIIFIIFKKKKSDFNQISVIILLKMGIFSSFFPSSKTVSSLIHFILLRIIKWENLSKGPCFIEKKMSL